MKGNEEMVRRVIGCIIRVHQVLGPGFLENVYRRALVIELRKNHLSVETEIEVRIYYEGCDVGFHKLDMLVERQIIIELKTVDALGKVQYAQIKSYLKAANLEIGLLVNFARERADFRRITFPHSPSFPPLPNYTERR